MSAANIFTAFLIHSLILAFLTGRLLRPRISYPAAAAALAVTMCAAAFLLGLLGVGPWLRILLPKLLCIPACALLLCLGSLRERLRLSGLCLGLSLCSEGAAFLAARLLAVEPAVSAQSAQQGLAADLLLMLSIAVLLFANRDLIVRVGLKILLAVIIGADLVHLVFLVFYYLTETTDKPAVTTLIQLAFQALLISIFFLQYFTVLRMHSLTEKEKELAAIRQEIGSSRRYYALADLRYMDISRLRHDIQNHFSVVRALMNGRRESEEEARSILNSISERLEAVGTRDLSSNSRLNAIMTVKLADMALEDTDLSISLGDVEQCPLSDNDLCSVVSELFDRGAGCCLRCGEGKSALALHSEAIEGRFVISTSCSFQKGEPIPPYDTTRLICANERGSFSVHAEDGTLTAEAVFFQ